MRQITSFPYLMKSLQQFFQYSIEILIQKSRDLEQVIRTKPNFSIILIKLREIFFSIVPTNIDDKNLMKNKE